MDDLQLRDELVTMPERGPDTVTDSIVWTMLLLHRNPAILRRVRRKSMAPSPPVGPLPASRQDGYLMRAFHESMRLYPPDGLSPVPHFMRFIGAIPSARRHRCHIALGRASIGALLGQTQRVDPDRFLPSASAGRHKFAYFPLAVDPASASAWSRDDVGSSDVPAS